MCPIPCELCAKRQSQDGQKDLLRWEAGVISPQPEGGA